MFTFDKEKCTGCGACILACMDAHSPNPDRPVQYRRLKRTEGLKDGAPFVRFEVLSCRHCENPVCIRSCPGGAIRKDGDFVRILESRCFGCARCIRACPFEAMVMDLVPKKCPGCEERYCEKACPLGVIGWK